MINLLFHLLLQPHSMFAAAANAPMDAPLFHHLRKQASFFLKEKLRTARLALTDVTPAQLLAEEATDASAWAPDAKTMRYISRAAFEVDDYWRIVEILHKKFEKFERKQWREAYKALILLEYLLTHGPRSFAEEFESDKEVIERLGNLEFVDERGFNWGLKVREKTRRVLKLLEKGQHLKEEREKARKISLGIQGFGSFNLPSLSSSSTSSNDDHEMVFSNDKNDATMNSENENFKCERPRKIFLGIQASGIFDPPSTSNSDHQSVSKHSNCGDVFTNSEKENLKGEAGATRRKGRTTEERVLQEISSNKMLISTDEAKNNESKPLLGH